MKQLESQQLASLILKNHLTYTMKANQQQQNSLLPALTLAKSAPGVELLRTMSLSPNNQDKLVDPSFIQTLLQAAKSNGNNNFVRRSESFSLNLSQSPLFLAGSSSSHKDAVQSLQYKNSNGTGCADSELENSLDVTSDDNEAFIEVSNKWPKKVVKKPKAIRMYSLDSQSRRSLSHLERDLLSAKGNDPLSQSDLSKITNGVKTPKSALLERRRKAVFELLLLDRYPSGKKSVYLPIF